MRQLTQMGNLSSGIREPDSKLFKLSLENSLLFPDQFAFLYNSCTSEITTQKGFNEFIENRQKVLSKDLLFQLVHPDERAKVKILYNKLYKFWCQDNSPQYEQVFSITYRIYSLKNRLRNVCCQTMIAKRLKKGIISLNMVSDISQYKTGSNILWALKGKGSHRFYEKNKLDEGEYNLTCRELEIVKCIAKGMKSKEIANYLQISLFTVYTHRRNMLTKMKFENIMQLVNFAFKKGLINV